MVQIHKWCLIDKWMLFQFYYFRGHKWPLKTQLRCIKLPGSFEPVTWNGSSYQMWTWPCSKAFKPLLWHRFKKYVKSLLNQWTKSNIMTRKRFPEQSTVKEMLHKKNLNSEMITQGTRLTPGNLHTNYMKPFRHVTESVLNMPVFLLEIQNLLLQKREKLFLLPISTHPEIYLLTFKLCGQTSLKDNHIIVFKYWLWRRGQVMKNKVMVYTCMWLMPSYLFVLFSFRRLPDTKERSPAELNINLCWAARLCMGVLFICFCSPSRICAAKHHLFKRKAEREINCTSPLSQNAFLQHPYLTPRLPGLSQWCWRNRDLRTDILRCWPHPLPRWSGPLASLHKKNWKLCSLSMCQLPGTGLRPIGWTGWCICSQIKPSPWPRSQVATKSRPTKGLIKARHWISTSKLVPIAINLQTAKHSMEVVSST